VPQQCPVGWLIRRASALPSEYGDLVAQERAAPVCWHSRSESRGRRAPAGVGEQGRRSSTAHRAAGAASSGGPQPDMVAGGKLPVSNTIVFSDNTRPRSRPATAPRAAPPAAGAATRTPGCPWGLHPRVPPALLRSRIAFRHSEGPFPSACPWSAYSITRRACFAAHRRTTPIISVSQRQLGTLILPLEPGRLPSLGSIDVLAPLSSSK